MTVLFNIEIYSADLADVIVNFKENYQEHEEQSVEEFLTENFKCTWIRSFDEWVISFGRDIVVEGLTCEQQAKDTYYFIKNLARRKAKAILSAPVRYEVQDWAGNVLHSTKHLALADRFKESVCQSDEEMEDMYIIGFDREGNEVAPQW